MLHLKKGVEKMDKKEKEIELKKEDELHRLVRFFFIGVCKQICRKQNLKQ